MDGKMHPAKTMLSLFNVVSMGSELVIYPLSSKLIKFVGGSMRCVLLGIFANSLRYDYHQIVTKSHKGLLFIIFDTKNY